MTNDPQVVEMTSCSPPPGGWMHTETETYGLTMLQQYKLAIIPHCSLWRGHTPEDSAAFVNEMAAALVKHDEEQMKGTT